MPLLWVLRDTLNMTGTKFGCGMALCGACTVHINGEAARSCITPVSSVAGKKVTTIEGLSDDGSHPVQQAWMEEDAPAMRLLPVRTDHSAVALLSKKPNPTDTDIDDAMSATSAAAAPTRASAKPSIAPHPCKTGKGQVRRLIC